MKKIILLLFLISLSVSAQPAMDGAFDGEAVWGAPKAEADGTAGWANANAKKFYSTVDNNYIYLGAEVTASNWMSWAFILNTKTGGGSTDSWSRNITNTHSNLPDYSIRGNFNNGWTEINTWNGTGWTGNGTDIGASEHGDNITGIDISGWIEVRVPRSVIPDVVGDIQFFITGDQTAHGTFDACPNDDNATGWSDPTTLSNYVTGVAIPVELVSFNVTSVAKSIRITWQTATELNNAGFDIERKQAGSAWNKIAFVKGNGTSNTNKFYSYTDEAESNGKYQYRLKQLDYNGTFEYSKVVEVEVNAVPAAYALGQNYPNPFNPSTTIRFSLPEDAHVQLSIFNVLGQEVRTLINGFKPAGEHIINFNAGGLNSGLYFYKLETANFNSVRKMLLTK